MAQHSHSHPPSLYYLLVVYRDSPEVVNRHLVLQAECMDWAAADNRSQGGFAALVDLAAGHTGFDRIQAMGYNLQEGAAGSCLSVDSMPLAAEDIPQVVQVLPD